MAPGTPGSASERPGCPPPASSAWVSQKQAKASTSPTISPAVPATAALAASTAQRRGTATNVVRIIPVEYSDVNVSTARIVSGSTVYSANPRKLVTCGSSGLPAGLAGACPTVPATIAVIARVTIAEISTVQRVARVERSLVHSKASTSRARAGQDGPLRPSGGFRVRVWVCWVVMAWPSAPVLVRWPPRRPGSRWRRR